MFARLIRTCYYADSITPPITKQKFLNKKYQKLLQQPVQKTDNLSGFYTILHKTEQCSCFKLYK